MNWLGWLLAFTVSLAAIGLVARRPEGRGVEVAVATLLCWLLLFSLGYALPRAAGAGELVSAATGVLLALVLLIACATLGIGLRAYARRYWETLKRLFMLPVAGGVGTARSLSVSVLGLLLSVVVLWTLISTKDTTVVTALGMGPRRPPNPAALVSDPFAVSLRLIAALLLLSSSYALVRRQGADLVAALGWSTVMFLTPGVLHSLRTATLDPTSFAIILGSLALAAQPDQKLFDAVLAYAALAIAASRQDWGFIAAAPAAAAIAMFSLTARGGVSAVRALAAFGGGLVLLALAGLLGHSLRPSDFAPGWPFQRLGLFEAPPPVDPLAPGRGLGLGFAWVTLPLAALGFVLLVMECALRLARRVVRGNSVATAPWPTLVVVLAAFLPACFQSTSSLPLAASAIVLCAWFCARLSVPRVAEGAIAVNMLAVVSFHWWHAW